ncbi:MAG: DHH family phosphoesterase [Clostridia bacterium]|nr:DHH family phosphoesterase [Clostridia bacterium]
MKSTKYHYIRFLIYILAAVLAVFTIDKNAAFGIIALSCAVGLFVVDIFILSAMGESSKISIRKISSQLNFMAKNMFADLTIPVTILDREGKILWYNDKFSNIFSDEEISFGDDIKTHLPEFNNDILNYEDTFEGTIGERNFTIYQSLVVTDNFENMFALYWVEDTYYKAIERKYNESAPCVCQILIDNYEDATDGIKETDKVRILSVINDILVSCARSINGAVYKTSNERYIMFFDKKGLDELIKNKFSVLDKVRQIEIGNKIPITLSFGIGNSAEGIKESAAYAVQGLDMALGRGGDQAVLKNDEKLEFYGGKTQSVVSRSRVKSRMITNALVELINASSNVIIMGHRNADVDALASSIGMARFVLSLGVDCKVLINENNNSCQKMIDEYMASGFETYFCDEQQAILNVEKNTLLIVCDTHSPRLVESGDLLDSCQRVVVIDHHRRLGDYIEKSLLSYHESFASSASEMVCEILSVYGKDIINKEDATALLAGIMLDTKDFMLNTSSRTFEAAGYLRTEGGDTVKAKDYFSIDLDNYRIRSSIVSGSFIYKEEYAISLFDGENFENIGINAAASADELLSIDGIKASFVLYKSNNGVNISCRSLGEINVQVIAEKLSGGGHFTAAAAQIENIDLETAKDMLIKAIDEVE